MKRLVMCADGTWNKPEQTVDGNPRPTNVVKLATAIQPVDASGVQQIVFYHSGVGERGGLWDHLSGGAFGVGISRNIIDLYSFLVTNYDAGDEVWLFGFSRGAYTVRSLAGLIRHCGLLRRANLRAIHDAYALYRRRSGRHERKHGADPDSPERRAFRERYSWPYFQIRFIGVWDTVGALGIPVTPLRFWDKRHYEFHDVRLSRYVDHAYQALAIDEARRPFAPSIWAQEADASPDQVLQQAWFPGVHTDVGGGDAEVGLSDYALAWIGHRAAALGLALGEAPEGRPSPIGESMTLFYRLLGVAPRHIGLVERGNEGLHEAVRRLAKYAPANLAAFLKRLHPNEPRYYEP